ncbi:MAG: hypothetical protein KDJ47_16945 [Hyphomicrobiaceae bacterium]|nr:hypothetical protein [Hyphomicrobiaceae bacterium]
MRTTKILEKVDRILEPDLGKSKRAKLLRELLRKLEHKRQKIENKLDSADTLPERLKLDRKLRACIAQLEKGHRALSASAR